MWRIFCVGVALVGGCAAWSARHAADAAFLRGLAAQLGGDDAGAEPEYRRATELAESAAAWNNLAVIAARRHHYRDARHLLSRAVDADRDDLVAITNYGVMSYWLADFGEARRAFGEARTLRQAMLATIPSTARTTFDEDRFARETAGLDATCARYLERMEQAPGMFGAEPPGDVLIAERARRWF
jgi:Tfp pilus assembly protein PilF